MSGPGEYVQVSELVPGDMLDLEGDPYLDCGTDRCPECATTRMAVEFEFAEVNEVIPETADCILVHTSLVSIGWPPSHEVKRVTT